MIRRFNYTGRKRLARGHVTVRLARDAEGGVRFGATLILGTYALPPEARVFVEAYRQTSWQRFDFGTVRSPAAREPTVLRDFGSAQGIRFRVRVVEPAIEAPRILALLDDLRPAAAPDASGGLSLLPVDWGDLDGQPWKLEVDDETGPLLLVSRKLVPERDAFVGCDEFASLVLPIVLRNVLERAVVRAGAEDDDGEGWAADWLRLARQWPGVAAPPERGDGDALTEDEEDWVDDAVRAFAASAGVATRFQKWWATGLP